MLVLYCLLSSLILLLTTENITYDSNRDILKAVQKSPIAHLSNVFIIFSTNIVFANIFKNLMVSHLILFAIFSFVGMLNYQMLYYRREYLKPIDLKLFKETVEISENLDWKIPKTLYFHIFLNIVFVVILFISRNLFDYSLLYLLFMPIGLGFKYLIQNDDFCIKTLKIDLDKYSDFGDFQNNGFLFSFFRNIKTFSLKPPKNYKKNISKELLKDTDTQNVSNTPNIIIIMNESFFNVNEVKGLNLSKNPLPTFDSIKANCTNGNIISPVIGGGTCQPEYEMLTGNSVVFTYKYKIAFLEFFKDAKKKATSVVSVLKDLGYSSRFIHPYRKGFYNRLTAYNSLGFEKIIDIEDFSNPYCPREFISDLDCYKKVVDEYENRDIEKPFFSMIVTMQNHPGYLSGEKFDKHDIKVLNNVSVDEKTMLENYVNLLKESDDAIKYIIDYFNDKENTVILFFGDHQPTENIGFSSISERSDLELSRTPFFIWNNYGLSKKAYGDIGSFYLSAILLDHINIKSDKYFNYLYEQLNTFTAFNTSFVIDKDNNYINRSDISIEVKETLKKLELVQFDRI